MAVYVVWSTQLGARESHVPDATTLMTDPRARHYWDSTLSVGRSVSPHLGLDSPAWDVWLLYGRDAIWGGDTLPEPEWWEHQLRGLPDSLRLDPDRFGRKARELLEQAPVGSSSSRPLTSVGSGSSPAQPSPP